MFSRSALHVPFEAQFASRMAHFVFVTITLTVLFMNTYKKS